MAVVLPIHSPLNFSEKTEEEYDRQRQQHSREKEEVDEKSENDFLVDSVFDAELEDKRCGRLGEREIAEADHSMELDSKEEEALDVSGTRSQNETLECIGNAWREETTHSSTDSNEVATKLKMSEENDVTRQTHSSSGDLPENHANIEDDGAFIDSLMAVDVIPANKDESSSTNGVAIKLGPSVVENPKASIETSENSSFPEASETDIFGIPLLTCADMEIEGRQNANIDESISTALAIANETIPCIHQEEHPYGGLENLGNTCYMASAIQLLCGLDSFPSDLIARSPQQKEVFDDHDEGSVSDQGYLRDALVDVIERLGKGETVRPNGLKRCIDSRTSLFLGYRQQDSHEFLTTLLDLIDEEYKKKMEVEELKATTNNGTLSLEEESKESNDGLTEQNASNTLDGALDLHETLSLEEQIEENNSNVENGESSTKTMDNADHSLSIDSPFKRQKLVDKLVDDESNGDARDENGGNFVGGLTQRSKSYSEFRFSDIESLLHEANDNIPTRLRSFDSLPPMLPTRQDEPKCKLAGGRMSTVGVELTRFEEDENVQHTDASLEKATPEQQIVEDEHYESRDQEIDDKNKLHSPVASNFMTKVRVCLTCESCKFRRSHIETYFHLSLDISSGSSDDDLTTALPCPTTFSIEDGLRKFFAPEKREIKCEKCFHTSALQTSEIINLPRNLLFHLKRFIVDVSPDYSSVSYRKDQSCVSFEERMEIDTSSDENDRHMEDDDSSGFRKFLALDCSYAEGAAYEIRSVVNHIGASASCGHYTADAKRRKKESDNLADGGDGSDSNSGDRQWTRFNDCFVSKITGEEAVTGASKTAYMIMYELV